MSTQAFDEKSLEQMRRYLAQAALTSDHEAAEAYVAAAASKLAQAVAQHGRKS